SSDRHARESGAFQMSGGEHREYRGRQERREPAPASTASCALPGFRRLPGGLCWSLAPRRAGRFHGGSIFNELAFGVPPELFKAVVFSHFLMEHMNDHVDVIDEHPLTLGKSLPVPRIDADRVGAVG